MQYDVRDGAAWLQGLPGHMLEKQFRGILWQDQRPPADHVVGESRLSSKTCIGESHNGAGGDRSIDASGDSENITFALDTSSCGVTWAQEASVEPAADGSVAASSPATEPIAATAASPGEETADADATAPVQLRYEGSKHSQSLRGARGTGASTCPVPSPTAGGNATVGHADPSDCDSGGLPTSSLPSMTSLVRSPMQQEFLRMVAGGSPSQLKQQCQPILGDPSLQCPPILGDQSHCTSEQASPQPTSPAAESHSAATEASNSAFVGRSWGPPCEEVYVGTSQAASRLTEATQSTPPSRHRHEERSSLVNEDEVSTEDPLLESNGKVSSQSAEAHQTTRRAVRSRSNSPGPVFSLQKNRTPWVPAGGKANGVRDFKAFAPNQSLPSCPTPPRRTASTPRRREQRFQDLHAEARVREERQKRRVEASRVTEQQSRTQSLSLERRRGVQGEQMKAALKTTFYERNDNMGRRREQLVAQALVEKKLKYEAEMQECTFRPEILTRCESQGGAGRATSRERDLDRRLRNYAQRQIDHRTRLFQLEQERTRARKDVEVRRDQHLKATMDSRQQQVHQMLRGDIDVVSEDVQYFKSRFQWLTDTGKRSAEAARLVCEELMQDAKDIAQFEARNFQDQELEKIDRDYRARRRVLVDAVEAVERAAEPALVELAHMPDRERSAKVLKNSGFQVGMAEEVRKSFSKDCGVADGSVENTSFASSSYSPIIELPAKAPPPDTGAFPERLPNAITVVSDAFPAVPGALTPVHGCPNGVRVTTAADERRRAGSPRTRGASPRGPSSPQRMSAAFSACQRSGSAQASPRGKYGVREPTPVRGGGRGARKVA
eukprot:gnl/TRDRNA2_/TRDRNA2_129523_c0_seq1.p1 gnl/TRDRNA2_/TRDRNA2_129523_c0~~gnl/TRDRNA2_/TRDRNA2_129523_c0_seq1.p1  ORF type:complete len:974 (-),score=146.32 gnl/TRDRNA2_/TRDRNA2_129523_c0_seq1:69-2579(-)